MDEFDKALRAVNLMRKLPEPIELSSKTRTVNSPTKMFLIDQFDSEDGNTRPYFIYTWQFSNGRHKGAWAVFVMKYDIVTNTDLSGALTINGNEIPNLFTTMEKAVIDYKAHGITNPAIIIHTPVDLINKALNIDLN